MITHKGSVRSLTTADIPATLKLFLRVFRGSDAADTSAFHAYFQDLLFGSPSYSPEIGSFGHEEEDGSIGSAVIAVPMQFVANGRTIPARLLCAYMTDGKSEATGAAALALSTRAKTQDFAFSDSASPKSRAHVRALGGIGLTVQNLEWIRVFRPLGALAVRVERRLPGRKRLGLPTLMRPFDAAIHRICSRIRPPDPHDLTVSDMPLETFLDVAPRLIRHYAVRPLWSRDELAWLVGMASRNTSHGPLRLRAIRDKAGDIVGCFVYYDAPGRSATVLNLLAEKGWESRVFAAMLHDLDRAGCTDAAGRALPALMEGLAAQSMLSLRHKAFVCVITKHPDIINAAERGDIYLGGLAGESWSRLMTDFT